MRVSSGRFMPAPSAAVSSAPKSSSTQATPIRSAHYRHQLAPDPNAALQWLRVRQPRKWRIREEEKSDPTAKEMIERALARVADYEPPVVPFRPKAKIPAPFYVPDKARARARSG
ncbi:MAG: hypothetical protein ABIS51_09375 [Sphingomonas sp.]